MARVLKLTRQEGVALFEAIGYTTATKWDDAKLAKKLAQMPRLVPNKTLDLTDDLDVLLTKVLNAVGDEEQIEVIVGDVEPVQIQTETEPQEKREPIKQPKKKKKTKPEPEPETEETEESEEPVSTKKKEKKNKKNKNKKKNKTEVKEVKPKKEKKTKKGFGICGMAGKFALAHKKPFTAKRIAEQILEDPNSEYSESTAKTQAHVACVYGCVYGVLQKEGHNKYSRVV